MLARVPDRMTVEEFLAWEQQQDEKHELIDGVPVLRAIRKGWVGPQAMAGGTSVHNHIALNIVHALKPRLRGGPCKPLGSDVAVRTAAGRTRYPDAFIECGPIGANLVALEPRVIFEVLSLSNSAADQFELLDDYQSIQSIGQVVYVEQRLVSVVSWVRHEIGWHRQSIGSLEAELPIPAFGFELPLSEIYDGVPFDV